MEKDTKTIRTILFNVLVILTILFIYFMFFPKKSYVKEKLNNVTSPQVEETFNQNINSMKIAANRYFEENDKTSVTLKELIKNNLLVDLKDSNDSLCDTEKSYSELKDKTLYVHLKCTDSEKTIEEKFEENEETEIEEKEEIETKENEETETKEKEETETKEKKKLFCLYQYEKQIEEGYTDWSDWSNWQLEEVEKDEFTNVETKIEEELDGTKIVNDSREISIQATKNTKKVCPQGYSEVNSKCIKKTELNTITASISYTCPSGYKRNATTCYKDGNTTTATKNYYCPTNNDTLEYELSGSNCKIYRISYKDSISNETYYTCPSNYKLKGANCYKTEYFEKEVDNYKEVTYYRYQKREKQNKKTVIKWSTPNNNNLLNDEYNMTREIFCEF